MVVLQFKLNRVEYGSRQQSSSPGFVMKNDTYKTAEVHICQSMCSSVLCSTVTSYSTHHQSRKQKMGKNLTNKQKLNN